MEQLEPKARIEKNRIASQKGGAHEVPPFFCQNEAGRLIRP